MHALTSTESLARTFSRRGSTGTYRLGKTFLIRISEAPRAEMKLGRPQSELVKHTSVSFKRRIIVACSWPFDKWTIQIRACSIENFQQHPSRNQLLSKDARASPHRKPKRIILGTRVNCRDESSGCTAQWQIKRGECVHRMAFVHLREQTLGGRVLRACWSVGLKL